MDIILSFFRNVESLAEYLRKRNLVVCGPPSFTRFLSSILVCSELDYGEVHESGDTNMFETYQFENMDQALEWTIRDLLNRDNYSNILCNGFRLRRAFDSGLRQSTVECLFPNTLLNQMKDGHWNNLCQQVGPRAICDILLCTNFKLLRNSSYLQLTGAPITAIQRSFANVKKNVIQRWRVMYSNSFVKSAGFPPNHPLNTLVRSKATNKARAWSLARSIFGCGKIYIGRRVLQVCPYFENMFGRYSRIKFGRLLEKRCPCVHYHEDKHVRPNVRHTSQESSTLIWHIIDEGYCSQQDDSKIQSSLETSSRSGRTCSQHSALRSLRSLNIEQLLKMDSKSDCVAQFVRDVIVAMFPRDFWGGSLNFQVILRKVTEFIKLRRHETMTVSDVTKMMKPSSITWLQYPKKDELISPRKFIRRRPQEFEIQQALLKQIVEWLFSSIVIPLIRSSFFVSEREARGSAVAYFRKPIWAAIRGRAKESKLTQYFPMNQEERRAALSHEQMSSLAVSSVRLLPKEKSVRAIANLSKRRVKTAMNRELTESTQSTNSTLTPLYHVLKYECSSRPNVFGYGVTGLDDIHRKIMSYVARTKRESVENGKLYFVTLDLKQCFDRINQHRVLEIANGLFSHDYYLVQRSSVVHPLTTIQRLHTKQVRTVSIPGEIRQLWGRAQDMAGSHTRSVVVDCGTSILVRREQLIGLLGEHVSQHVVHLSARGVQYYRQSSGIAQGSILSSLLCNIYYGQVESKLFPGGSIPGRDQSLLMRMMDDFLFVSTSVDEAQLFCDIMYDADRTGMFELNKEKTRANFGAFQTACEGSPWFSWCGVELNDHDLNVRANTSKFLNSSPFDLISLDSTCYPGQSLKVKMKSYMLPKFHSILFDSDLNSLELQCQNVFDLCKLGAAKAQAHLCVISRKYHIENSGFVLKCIMEAISYFGHIIRKKTRKLQSKSSGRLNSVASSDMVMYIGLKAFSIVFHKQCRVRISCIRHAIIGELKRPQYTIAKREMSRMCAAYIKDR